MRLRVAQLTGAGHNWSIEQETPRVDKEKPFDSIVIGAGIIGAAITLELTRRGHRTLCVDKLPAAGYGSTSNSCA